MPVAEVAGVGADTGAAEAAAAPFPEVVEG